MLAAGTNATSIAKSNLHHRHHFVGNEFPRGLTLRGRIVSMMIPSSLPPIMGNHQVARTGTVRALIDGGDRAVRFSAPVNSVRVQATVVIRNKMKVGFFEKLEWLLRSLFDEIDPGILIQLISEELDSASGSEKDAKFSVRLSEGITSVNEPHLVKYNAEFTLPKEFGKPGAILVTNNHWKEVYLVEITLKLFKENSIVFPARSWIQPRSVSEENRIFFTNKAYLRSKTPAGITKLRDADMVGKRGDGEGERKRHERIYDYATYNDLGNPSKMMMNLSRPVLAGEERPYPRRCRTGRLAAVSDLECESREKLNRFYVPRDEHFEEIKNMNFSDGRLRGYLHSLLPMIAAFLAKSELLFNRFSDIDNLYKYNPGKDEHHHANMLSKIIKNWLQKLKYDVPHIIQRDRYGWLRNVEFARQALAGVNPVSIELLKEFPIVSKLDPAIYGPPESAITKQVLGKLLSEMSVEEAIKTKRLFVIDYHDLLLPFVNKINSLPNRKCYASRTIFYLNNSGVLKPVAIELALPPTSSDPAFRRVYTHHGHSATGKWIWNQAKAHVCAVDVGVHQLIHHWLRTHACMEPYIIATHRQLSTLHPIFKLLHPHMRYTMDINSRARKSLINGGGVFEASFTPGKYSMELGSAAYKTHWRFDMEALPADLIRRGMAEEDPSSEHGIKLLIEDYPYAADGLLIWSAIQEWVQSYVFHFYSDDSNAVSLDVELQNWWDEIQNQGHPDKRNESWWPQLKTKQDLISILTIIIWTASGQHAAINFGQYPFGGYIPSRPTLMRKLIPQEDKPDEYTKFLLNPQQSFLNSLPTQLQATTVMAVQETLSTHSEDEEYLGQLHTNWIDDNAVLEMHAKFSSRMKVVEEIIKQRNEDHKNINRTGAGIPPYELLLPSSVPGVTGRGIPNSISI